MCGKSFGISVSPINLTHTFQHSTSFTDPTLVKHPQYMIDMLQDPLIVYKFLAPFIELSNE
jgi:hypothetical protein